MNRRQRRLVAVGGLGAIIAAIVLWPDNPDGGAPVSVPVLRMQALGLLDMYLGNGVFRGDARFKEIAKDYGGIGTTCGYLPAWLLWRLGCRDGRLVNRAEPSAGLAYGVGMNIAKLVQGSKALGAWVPYVPGGQQPQPGDILYFGAVDANGGVSHEHVAVDKLFPASGQGSIVTYDMGHSIQPEGSVSTRSIDAAGNVNFMGTSRKLIGFVSMALIPFTAEPDLTDHTLAAA